MDLLGPAVFVIFAILWLFPEASGYRAGKFCGVFRAVYDGIMEEKADIWKECKSFMMKGDAAQ